MNIIEVQYDNFQSTLISVEYCSIGIDVKFLPVT